MAEARSRLNVGTFMFSRLLRTGLGAAVYWFPGTARRAAAFVSGQLDLESPEKLKVQSRIQKRTSENQNRKAKGSP